VKSTLGGQEKIRSVIMGQIEEKIKCAVNKHFPSRSVHKINDRGVWERHIIKVELDDKEIIFFKI
jgi:hypothetical protein